MPAASRRSVEALARVLYEASDPVGMPWVRRTRIIREAWLMLADERMAKAEQPAGIDWAASADPLARGEKGCC